MRGTKITLYICVHTYFLSQIYMQPLQKMSSPPIDREQVQTLFGPLAEVMTHHELFYTALTARTMEWGRKQTIGSVFMTVSAAAPFHYMYIEALVMVLFRHLESCKFRSLYACMYMFVHMFTLLKFQVASIVGHVCLRSHMCACTCTYMYVPTCTYVYEVKTFLSELKCTYSSICCCVATYMYICCYGYNECLLGPYVYT